MLRVLLLALLAGLVLATGRSALWAQDSAIPSNASETRRELELARGEAARARERAALLDKRARSALLASDKAMLGVAALAARVQQAEAALAASEADLALIGQRRRALDKRLARESAPVAQLLAGLQTQIRRPALLQLLQPGTLTDAVHLRAVLVAVQPQIQSRTAELRAELARARALERATVQIAAQRRRLQSDLKARRAQLTALSAAEQLKARRAAVAADREAERAYAIGANARDLSALVSEIETAKPEPRPVAGTVRPLGAGGTANLAEPHRLPVQGRLAATQNSPRKGLTLLPRPNALVVAPGPGRVAFAGPYRGFGAIVILEHPGGWTSLLTGLARVQVAVGQTVVAGSPLGQVGARDPRLMIELRRAGVPVDPLTQLR